MLYSQLCRVQCVAFAADSQHVAAGDASGRILIWSRLGAAAQRAGATHGKTDGVAAGMQLFEPPRWHATTLHALCFSADGAYMLSGGSESVLVIWQLETMHRTYLPRLGGPITHIQQCPDDPAHYLLGQQDNAARLVSLARMEVLLSVHGVRPPAAGQPAQDAARGCALQPGTGHLAVPGCGGSVQLYDAARDTHVDRLLVIARNTVTSTDAQGVCWCSPAACRTLAL